MASVVQICNMALSHIGADARVSSISPPDGSVEAGHCATFYDLARTEMLEPGNWAFALKRASLAQVTNPSTVWAYAYAKPADCMRVLRILRPSIAITVFTQDLVLEPHTDDRDSAPFDVEGEVILTNEPDAVLVYCRDVTDSTKFPASFTSALSYLLASYLAGPIVKGNEGVRLGEAMRQRAQGMADISATASANASSADTLPQPTLLAVRA
ncbi:MAG: hypothetical protein ACO25M_00080 [Limnohabitans sp.]|jgi:hypothetical protein